MDFLASLEGSIPSHSLSPTNPIRLKCGMAISVTSTCLEKTEVRQKLPVSLHQRPNTFSPKDNDVRTSVDLGHPTSLSLDG